MSNDGPALPSIPQVFGREAAGALGRAGLKLRAALDLLALHDAGGAPQFRREPLLEGAVEALWAYLVQKEAMGLTDTDCVDAVYRVPREVWRRLGIVRPGAD